jgi:hypothetical protein
MRIDVIGVQSVACDSSGDGSCRFFVNLFSRKGLAVPLFVSLFKSSMNLCQCTSITRENNREFEEGVGVKKTTTEGKLIQQSIAQQSPKTSTEN